MKTEIEERAKEIYMAVDMVVVRLLMHNDVTNSLDALADAVSRFDTAVMDKAEEYKGTLMQIYTEEKK